MDAIQLESINLNLHGGSLTRVPSAPVFTPVGPDRSVVWRCLVRGYDGVIYAEFPNAQPPDITWNPPNIPDTAVVQIPLDSPNLFAMNGGLAPPREVELWRNGRLLFTGRCGSKRVDSDSRMLECNLKDPTSLFTKRYVGAGARGNHLGNGTFEGGTTGWATTGTGITMSSSTDVAFEGTHALKLVGTNVVNGARYAHSSVYMTGGALGKAIAVNAVIRISNFLKPAAFGAGLMLRRVGATGPGSQAMAFVTKDTLRHKWVGLECALRIPAGARELIEVRLYAIAGTSYWDDVRLTREDSITFLEGEDEGTVLRDIVNYAQGKGRYGDRAPEKSDLGIVAIMPITGQVLDQDTDYRFSEHQKLYEGTGPGARGVMDYFLNKTNGLDWRFEPQGRILRGYYPTVGTIRDGIQFSWHRQRQGSGDHSQDYDHAMVGWQYGDQDEAAANVITELGRRGGQAFDGDPSAEEGFYSNPDSLGGLTQELVEASATGYNIQQLNRIAANRGAQLEGVVHSLALRIVEPRDPISGEVTHPLIGDLLPGDWVFADIIDGEFHASSPEGGWRVAQVSFDGATEVLTTTVNV